jgi:hypothetical protein
MGRFDATDEEIERLIASRAVPESDRIIADPFAKGISEQERARRIEGRKFTVAFYRSDKTFEVLYRVDLHRRLLADRGLQGILQFYGLRATRVIEGGKAGEWEVEPRIKMHTVELEDGFSPSKSEKAKRRRSR